MHHIAMTNNEQAIQKGQCLGMCGNGFRERRIEAMLRDNFSPEERQALNSGRWFGSLSPSLRHDLVRHGVVRRFADGEPVFLRGQDSTCWAAVVGGNVRVSTSHASGKQLTLCYMRPGLWFCDASVLHDQPRSYDAHAHGPVAMLTVCIEHAQEMLRRHRAVAARIQGR